jgi:hypothetical protein
MEGGSDRGVAQASSQTVAHPLDSQRLKGRIRGQTHSPVNCVRRATATDPSFPSITNIPANAFRSKLMGVPSPSHPNTTEGRKMIVHLLTCLTLAALTSYVVALKLFDLGSVLMTADEGDSRVVAPAN